MSPKKKCRVCSAPAVDRFKTYDGQTVPMCQEHAGDLPRADRLGHVKRLVRILRAAAKILVFPVAAGVFMVGWAMINPEDRERWRQRFLGRKKKVMVIIVRQRR